MLPDGTKQSVTPPDGVWVSRHYLDVVDHADPAHPTVRPPVNLPGELIGVAAEGALLFTVGAHWSEDGRSDGRTYVDACAYDGVSASRVAGLPLPAAEWPQVVTAAAGQIFLARPAPAPETAGMVEVWAVNEAGTFVQQGKVALAAPARQLKGLGAVVAALGSAQLTVLGADAAGAWSLIGGPVATGCYWPDLGRAVVVPGSALWLPLGDFGVLGVPLN